MESWTHGVMESDMDRLVYEKSPPMKPLVRTISITRSQPLPRGLACSDRDPYGYCTF